MKNYKKDFIESINFYKSESKAIEKKHLKNAEEFREDCKQRYKTIVTQKFIYDLHDAVDTVKKNISAFVSLRLSHLLPESENDHRVSFSISNNEYSMLGDTLEINIYFWGSRVQLASNVDVFEQKNDLGDMEPKDSVFFPNVRGRIKLEERDIIEIHEQFIRAIYDISKRFYEKFK